MDQVPVPPPVPKPRTKFMPQCTDFDLSDASVVSSSSSELTPPPRPPPPRRKTPENMPPPELPPRPSHMLYHKHADSITQTPPPLPPRHNRINGVESTMPRPTLSLDTELHLPPFSSVDKLPCPPNIGWRSPRQPSLEEVLEPLPEIPQGSTFSTDHDWDSVVERLPSDLIPDRPLLPDYFDSNRASLASQSSVSPSTSFVLPPPPVLPPPKPPRAVTSVKAEETTTPSQSPDPDNWEFASWLNDENSVTNPIYCNINDLKRKKNREYFYNKDCVVNRVYVVKRKLEAKKQAAGEQSGSLKQMTRPSFIDLNISDDAPKNITSGSSSSDVTPTNAEPPQVIPSSTILPPVPMPRKRLTESIIPPELPPRPHRMKQHTAELPIMPQRHTSEDPDDLTPIATEANSFVNFRPTPPTSADLYAGENFNTDSFLPASTSSSCFSFDDVTTVEEIADPGDPVPLFVEHVAVFFSGMAEYISAKKEKKQAFIVLKNDQIEVFENEEAEKTIAGPFDLHKAEFIGLHCGTGTIVCRFHPRSPLLAPAKVSSSYEASDSKRELRFTPLEQLDSWLLLLGQCFLASWDELRQSAIEGMTACGRIWLRQGITAQWTCAVSFLHKNFLSYLVLQHANVTYELDLRKIVSIKGDLDQADWCPHVHHAAKSKDKGQGPFLIALEGGSVYIECDDPSTTALWRRLLESVLDVSPTDLKKCRLNGDNVPVHIDKCIRFMSTYGLKMEGIYRKNGRVAECQKIREALSQDPWDYHIIYESDETVQAVGDVLRQFLRRLDEPLMPLEFQEAFYNTYSNARNESQPRRSLLYKEIFKHKDFPQVNYCTLRRLIVHLVAVEEFCSQNKASFENLAKIFGPTLFSTEKSQGSIQDSPLTAQIGILYDFMMGAGVIFEVTHSEGLASERIRNIHSDIVARQHKKQAGDLLIPIHVWEYDNRCFNVSSELFADQVCIEARKIRSFGAPADASYALFEVILGGALTRRVRESEKLAAIACSRWMQWKCKDGYFLFNHDTHPYDPMQTNSFSGKVKAADPGSKKFSSLEFALESSNDLSLWKNGKQLHSWPITNVVCFTGVASSRKPPTNFGATIFISTEVKELNDKAGYAVCWASNLDRTCFLNAMTRAQKRFDNVELIQI